MLVTCDNCDATDEAGWGDTPLCIDCQWYAEPDLVCEDHWVTHYPDELCPVCKAEGY